MNNELKYTDKYFEILVPGSRHPLSNSLGKVYVIAKNRAEANKKVRDLDPVEQAKFRAFRHKFISIQDQALTLSDQAIENGFDLPNRNERIKCFKEALLRVFISGVEGENSGFIGWMIITMTSEIIEQRNQEMLSKKK